MRNDQSPVPLRQRLYVDGLGIREHVQGKVICNVHNCALPPLEAQSGNTKNFLLTPTARRVTLC